MTAEIKSAYLAPEGLSEPLLNEIDGVIAVHDRLILSSQPAKNAYWAQNIWRNPQTLPIDSINDAAKKLKIKRLDMGSACEKKNIKIKPCQLGAF